MESETRRELILDLEISELVLKKDLMLKHSPARIKEFSCRYLFSCLANSTSCLLSGEGFGYISIFYMK